MIALLFMLIMFVVMTAYSIYSDYRKEQVYHRERSEWAKEREYYTRERQLLLDRIQAPSFDHLKHHEVKVIKAQNAQPEPPPLEQL